MDFWPISPSSNSSRTIPPPNNSVMTRTYQSTIGGLRHPTTWSMVRAFVYSNYSELTSFSSVSNKIFGVILTAYIDGLRANISRRVNDVCSILHWVWNYWCICNFQSSAPGTTEQSTLSFSQKVHCGNKSTVWGWLLVAIETYGWREENWWLQIDWSMGNCTEVGWALCGQV